MYKVVEEGLQGQWKVLELKGDRKNYKYIQDCCFEQIQLD